MVMVMVILILIAIRELESNPSLCQIRVSDRLTPVANNTGII